MSVYFKNKSEYEFESYEEFLFFEYQYAMRKLDYVNIEFSNDGEKMKDQFEKVMESQKILSLFQTLKSQCDFLSLTQKYKFERDNVFENQIIDHIRESEGELNDTFTAYLLVFNLFKENNSEEFFKLKDIVLHSDKIVYERNNRALLGHLQNFCIKYYNSGKTEFLSHLFDCYKYSLRYIKNEGDMTSISLRNISFCALQLGEIAWAESLVENFKSKVSADERDNAYNFSLARISFEKKDYTSAMRLLLRVTYEDAFYASSARILLIKCYYELNDEMPLISCCASLLQFLKRSKDFTKQRIDNNIHFIQLVKNLQTNRLKNNAQLFKRLYEKIDKSSVVEKEWLKQKVTAIWR
jgi:hypothetical protein